MLGSSLHARLIRFIMYAPRVRVSRFYRLAPISAVAAPRQGWIKSRTLRRKRVAARINRLVPRDVFAPCDWQITRRDIEGRLGGRCAAYLEVRSMKLIRLEDFARRWKVSCAPSLTQCKLINLQKAINKFKLGLLYEKTQWGSNFDFLFAVM